MDNENKKVNVLFGAFEASPFIKTGGLGDVAGALPLALCEEGVDCRVIMPLFSSIKKEYKDKMEGVAEFNVSLSWRNQYVGLKKLKYKNTIFYFIDNEYYFKRDNAYGYFDDGERIAFFSKALVESIKYMDFKPEILHLNDWHTALSAVYIREMYNHLESFRKIKTIFTVHNLKFQGKFSPFVLDDVVGLEKYPDARRQLLEKDACNYMRGALNYVDYITTVSPTYSNEVKNSYYGEGLQEIFKRRESIFKGIINGIDTESYNPETDKNIYTNYSLENLELKKENKIKLQKDLGLKEDKDVCMIGMVGRLTSQKGLDLVTTIFEEMINTLNVEFVLLGVGDKKYEDSFRYFENKYKGKVSSNLHFSEEKSRKIYAASDLFLVPSIFEPCGLSQLIAMRYFTVPIVRETGGLKDTVIPYNKYTGEGTGFSFSNINAHELLYKIKEAVNLYYNENEKFAKVMKAAGEKDYSWVKSAKEYKKLYYDCIS